MICKWYLWPTHELLSVATDQFLVRSFMLRLSGGHLEIEAEGSREHDAISEARNLAEQYLTLLKKNLGVTCTLVTEEVFATRLAQAGTMSGPDRRERARVQEAIRKIRNEMLLDGDPTLLRCYDYMQKVKDRRQAPEPDDDVLGILYKVSEAIENQLGGEKPTGEILGIAKELKFLKRLANEPLRDERHAPKPTETVVSPSQGDRGQAMEFISRIVRAYESHVRNRKSEPSRS